MLYCAGLPIPVPVVGATHVRVTVLADRLLPCREVGNPGGLFVDVVPGTLILFRLETGLAP